MRLENYILADKLPYGIILLLGNLEIDIDGILGSLQHVTFCPELGVVEFGWLRVSYDYFRHLRHVDLTSYQCYAAP
jgi:hypothetical protein